MPEPTERDDGSTGAANRKGRDYAASGGKAFIGRIPWLGFWAWSFVGLVVATMIVVIPCGGQRDNAATNVCGGAGSDLQAPGRSPDTTQGKTEHRGRPAGTRSTGIGDRRCGSYRPRCDRTGRSNRRHG
jgi:hypothetical protein